MFLLDTNICIDIIRGKSRHALDHLAQQSVGEVAISSITLAELEYGVAKSIDPGRNAAALIKFCVALEILPFDGAACSAYGRIRVELEEKGTPIGPLDTLIAAHAMAAGAVLVTHNMREFKRIGGLEVVNWTRG